MSAGTLPSSGTAQGYVYQPILAFVEVNIHDACYLRNQAITIKKDIVRSLCFEITTPSHGLGAFRPAHQSRTSSTLLLRSPKIPPCHATWRLTDIVEPALKIEQTVDQSVVGVGYGGLDAAVKAQIRFLGRTPLHIAYIIAI